MEELIKEAIGAGCNIWVVGILAVAFVASEVLGKTEKVSANGVVQGVIGLVRAVIRI